jgi:type II secretory pathway pseudopilin PulG
MPNGERRSGPAPARCRGYTYVLLLFVMAIAAAGLGALGEHWLIAAQREREAELLFRGAEYGQALAAYRDATPPGQPAAPERLEDLLEDARTHPPGHLLRRLYTDPFSGQPDWDLKRNPQGRIEGLSSRSRHRALRHVGVPLAPDAEASAPTVGDWLFLPPAAGPTAASAAAP